ncbi:MAG: DNA-processing protein DprA [Stellaceae bacterium]
MATTRTLNPAERLDWLRLIRTENIGPITFYQLLARYGSAEAAVDALPELARRGGRNRPLRVPTRAQALHEMAALDRAGAKFIAWGEADYPIALAAIEDAPPLLAARGRLELTRRRAVAIVGARNASANGRRFARDVALQLGRHELVVVSGLARGIDAAAHEGALETGTIAVLATGIDKVYPDENRALHETIAERGLVLAEQPVGTEPLGRHFPRRNRIISGIALGVLVVEAALKSGSLITARFALEQGREVFAVPGSPLDPRCRGTNDLIRRGARLTESADDILAEIAPGMATPAPVSAIATVDREPMAELSDRDLERARTMLIEHLAPNPVPVDELVRMTHLSPSQVAAVLLELTLAGRIERQAGNQVALL